MNTTPASKELQPLIISIATGDDENMEKQLIMKSKQPNILKYTPNDAAKRFGNKEMFKAWKAGGREIYWLVGVNNDLAGIIWYGKKDFPLKLDLQKKPSETVAIRLYDGYNGHGLAVPAMLQTLALHVKAAQDRGDEITGIWLQTDSDNIAAQKVYTKLGYQILDDDGHRLTMVLTPDHIVSIISNER